MQFSFQAGSHFELVSVLNATDTTVPGRTEGRTAEHCERWTICRFFQTFASDSLISYPLNLIGQESPDCRLEMAGTQIGIEITSACHEDYEWARAIAEKTPGAMLEPSSFKPGNLLPRKSGLRPHVGHISQALGGLGWRGNEGELEWIEYVVSSINDKTGDLSKPGYGVFPHTWLIIYSNTPVFNVHVDEAVPLLVTQLERYWGTPSFSRIFVIVNEHIVEMTESGHRVVRIPEEL